MTVKPESRERARCLRDGRIRHPITECERLLQVSPSFDRFRCQPPMFFCTCGRIWHHICDEAEGCFYAEEIENG